MGFLVVKDPQRSAPARSEEVWINVDDIEQMREINTSQGVVVYLYQTDSKHEVVNASAEKIARAVHEIKKGNLPFLRI